MMFSANLGFLWSHLPFIDRIHAAKSAGFDAVECHWPYDVPAETTSAALKETGLQMLGINTWRGNVERGEFGLSALPGREADAKSTIDQAIAYSAATGNPAIHVMAGFSSGPKARKAFVENLAHATSAAQKLGIDILIEPLNHYDAPGYFLTSTGLAADIIREVGAPNLKMMFDCYHVQCMEGDVTRRLESLLPYVGHIQIAAVPDRGAPDHGELDYAFVLKRIGEMGWTRPVGAEFLTAGNAPPQLGWMKDFR